MQDDDIDEFNSIFEGLHVSLQYKVNNLLTNYSLAKDRFSDIYRTYEYNIGKDRQNHLNNTIPIEQEIIKQIEEKLMSEGQQQKRKTPIAVSKSTVGPAKATATAAMPGLDIFGALTYEKKQKKESQAAKASEKKVNGNMVNNSKSKIQQVNYN